jgi:hypothetical protein
MPAIMPPTEMAVIRGSSPLTKTYAGTPVGQIEKVLDPFLTSGTARCVRLDPAQPLAPQLARIVEGVGRDEALVLGQLGGAATGVDEAVVTTKARLDSVRAKAGGKPVVTRTKDTFGYAAGVPAVLGLDHDGKDLPQALRERLEREGGLLGVLQRVCPALGRAALVARPSVSTGIRHRASGQETPGGGLHVYVPILDGGDAAGFVDRLNSLLLLDGWGWPFVSKIGHVEVRSLLDTAASGRSERLWFEADAVLSGTDLEHVPGARTVQVQDGLALDTLAALPPLPKGTKADAERVKVDLKASAVAPAAQARNAWQEDRAAALVKQGMDPARAQRFAAQAPDALPGDWPLHLDDGRLVLVAEVLRDPAAFHGETCADPLEPDYGGGKNKARIHANSAWPSVFSHAHGGRTYPLRWGVEDIIEAAGAAQAANTDPIATVSDMESLAGLDDDGWARIAAATRARAKRSSRISSRASTGSGQRRSRPFS